MEELLHNVELLIPFLIPIVGAVVKMVKETNVVSPRVLPFVSAGLGIAIGLVCGYALGGDLFVYGMAGFSAGTGASWAHDSWRATKKREDK